MANEGKEREKPRGTRRRRRRKRKERKVGTGLGLGLGPHKNWHIDKVYRFKEYHFLEFVTPYQNLTYLKPTKK